MKARINFILPERREDQDDEAYGNEASISIQAQVQTLLQKVTDQDDKSEYEIDICQQLVAFAELQDSNVAYQILFEATQLETQPCQAAQNIIYTAYNNEKFVRSSFMHNPTFACVNEQAKLSSNKVMEFLTNPKWLLSWFEIADAVEISRVIAARLQPNTSYWAELRDKSNAERAKKSTPGFATICFILINPVELSEEDIHYLLTAFRNPEVRSAKLRRVLASAKARIRLPASFMPDENERKAYTIDAIRAAKGCFINSPYLSLTKADFCSLEINGAIFNRSNLIENNFQSCLASYAKFEQCSLVGTDFSDSDLTCASFAKSTLSKIDFRLAKLNGAIFTNAKLTGVDFSEADFTDADFTGCELAKRSNKFISRSAFRMDSLEKTFDELFAKIKEHAFFGDLRGAITRDLTEYCTACIRQPKNSAIPNDAILPPDKAIKILQLAYSHALFADPRKYVTLTKAANFAAEKGVQLYSWVTTRLSLYSATEGDKNAVATKLIDTVAQTDIRIAIEFLEDFVRKEAEAEQNRLIEFERATTRPVRPSPPKHTPAAVARK